MKLSKQSIISIKKLIFIYLVGTFMVTLYPLLTWGQINQLNQLVPNSGAPNNNDPITNKLPLWRINLENSYSQLLYSKDNGNNYLPYLSTNLEMLYLGWNVANVIISTSLRRDLTYDRNDQAMMNLRLNSKNLLTINSKIVYFMGFSAGLPIDYHQNFSSLIATLSWSHFFLFQETYPWSFFISYQMTGFIYEYETSLNGQINNLLSNRVTSSISYAIKDRIIINGNLGYRNRYSLQKVWRENIFHSQDITFLVTSKLWLSLGHSWGDMLSSLFKDNGQDFEFNLIDERNSILYI